jgi:hypothetical protein
MTGQDRRDYRDLILWQKSMDLAVEVHEATLRLPRHELFGLTASSGVKQFPSPQILRKVREGAPPASSWHSSTSRVVHSPR